MNYSAEMQRMRIGDWLVISCGILLVIWLATDFWTGLPADKAIIRSNGKVYRELQLPSDIVLHVPGPLGNTVVTIQQFRARITSDPSPRQYCVKQGWLSQSGEISVCLPNQVSLELTGGKKLYDSLNY